MNYLSPHLFFLCFLFGFPVLVDGFSGNRVCFEIGGVGTSSLSLSPPFFFLWFLLDFPVFVDGLFGSHVCLKFGGVNGDGSISIF